MALLKRLGFWVVTNIAVLAMVMLVVKLLSLFGINVLDHTSNTNFMIYCLIYGFVGSFFSLLISKWSAKKLMGLEIVDENVQDPKLKTIYNQIKEISDKAGIKMPEVGIYHSNDINAFATGAFKNSSLIGISTALINKMDNNEIEAVLAHEVSHIKNGDMVTLTLIQGVINAFVIFISNLLTKIIKNNNENLGAIAETFIYIGLQIFIGILASPIVAFFSRMREYKADEGSSMLVGKNKMIKALEKLKMEKENKNLPENLAAFGITGKYSIFSTHPPLEKRIEKLQNIFFN